MSEKQIETTIDTSAVKNAVSNLEYEITLRGVNHVGNRFPLTLNTSASFKASEALEEYTLRNAASAIEVVSEITLKIQNRVISAKLVNPDDKFAFNVTDSSDKKFSKLVDLKSAKNFETLKSYKNDITENMITRHLYVLAGISEARESVSKEEKKAIQEALKADSEYQNALNNLKALEKSKKNAILETKRAERKNAAASMRASLKK